STGSLLLVLVSQCASFVKASFHACRLWFSIKPGVCFRFHVLQYRVARLITSPMASHTQGRGFAQVTRWRNRKATSHRSHLARIPLEKLFSGRGDLLVYQE